MPDKAAELRRDEGAERGGCGFQLGQESCRVEAAPENHSAAATQMGQNGNGGDRP